MLSEGVDKERADCETNLSCANGAGGIDFPVHAGLASIHHAVEEAKSASSDDHTHIHIVLRSG